MGYTFSTNTTNRIATNAEFQTWGGTISAAIANCGLVQTTDTGQIDWGSVQAPTAAYVMMGYEIWRFNDALQNTAPVYLKLEYGSGAGGQTAPCLRWSLGSGSVGNGTLTGLGVRDESGFSGNTYVILNTSGVFVNNTLLTYISGDNNRLVLALNARGTGSAVGYGIFLSLERTVDTYGNPTPLGVLATWRAASPTHGQLVWNSKIGWIGTEAGGSWGILVPTTGGGTSGSNTAVYPVFHNWGGGAFLNPGLNVLTYFTDEITAGTSNTFTYYGASHTYMPLGNTQIYAIDPRGNNHVCAMMRWE